MHFLFNAFVFVLPWFLRRRLLSWFLGYKLHPESRIGWGAWIFPKSLEMMAGARIASGAVAVNLDHIYMGECCSIGRFTWITGFPSGRSGHFSDEKSRRPELHMKEHSAITKWHHIDCTSMIQIGRFTTIAGYYSQFLTHSINIVESKQKSAPIIIGDYCFVGTNAVFLGGSSIGDYSVVGAKALINKGFSEPYVLIGGVPGKVIKHLPTDSKYFTRNSGYIV